MPHPEEIYGIAVEGDTLFGALPLGKKPPGSVTRHFLFTILGDVCLDELDTSSASVVIVIIIAHRSRDRKD